MKRPKKEYDSKFYEDGETKRKFNRVEHAKFCWELLFKIAQESAEEAIVWNPHIRKR